MRQITCVLPMALKIVEVHNVWTICDSNSDKPPIAQMSRPQDWGNKSRWHYERFCFEWIQERTRYINHVHCWTDIKGLQRGEYPMLFATCIEQNCYARRTFSIMRNGVPGRRRFLE